MSLTHYKILAASVIFVISLLTAYFPLRKKYLQHHLIEPLQLTDALASGIFLGAALFHMLPEAIRQFAPFSERINYPFPELICMVGFLVPLFLERLSFLFDRKTAAYSVLMIILFVLGVHAFTEGAAVGVGTTLSETLLIAIAIIVHKSSEIFVLCITLIRQHLSFKMIVGIVCLFASITPLGIFFGNEALQLAQLQQYELLPASINAFSAGTFLYISTLHHTNFHKHRGEAQGLLEFFSIVTGVAIMGLIAAWI